MNLSEEKKRCLKSLMKEYAEKDVCVAFSGGVDSSLVLVLACEAARETKKKVYALTMDTVLHPKADLETARQVLEKTSAYHFILHSDELAVPEIRNNPVNRCYLCKKELYLRMLSFAREKGTDVLLEGSNEDDMHVYRPGRRAIEELKVHSPLARCHFTKEEVRAFAAEYGISVASRPSAPCLATRLPYGTEIDLSLLERIEKAEEFLKTIITGNIRVRLHGDILRLEADPEAMGRICEKREDIIEELKKVGVPYITLDLEGFRSGSMDIGLSQ